jgi:hypothetical protein
MEKSVLEIMATIIRLVDKYKVKHLSLNNQDFQKLWNLGTEAEKKQYPHAIHYDDLITIHRRRAPECSTNENNSICRDVSYHL